MMVHLRSSAANNLEELSGRTDALKSPADYPARGATDNSAVLFDRDNPDASLLEHRPCLLGGARRLSGER
jgi:hypothetical protein